MPPLQAPRRLGLPRGEHRRTSADRIFISYRRADSGGWARSLHDHLEERLGTGRSFRDVAMEAGVDFHEHVESLLDRCDVLLAVIGRRWASITDADGRRRLDDPGDLVAARSRGRWSARTSRSSPCWSDGAKMPAEHDLPPDLAPLTRRQAVELTDARWEYDVDKLTQRLRDLVGEKPHGPWWRALARAGGDTVVAALVGAALLLWAAFGSHVDQGPTTKAAKLQRPDR